MRPHTPPCRWRRPTATWARRPQLKGHGFEIVRYREERGRFDALRQLDEVPGLAGKWDGAETAVAIV